MAVNVGVSAVADALAQDPWAVGYRTLTRAAADESGVERALIDHAARHAGARAGRGILLADPALERDGWRLIDGAAALWVPRRRDDPEVVAIRGWWRDLTTAAVGSPDPDRCEPSDPDAELGSAPDDELDRMLQSLEEYRRWLFADEQWLHRWDVRAQAVGAVVLLGSTPLV